MKKYLRLTTWYMFSIDITLSTATLKPDAHSEYVSAALKPGPRRSNQTHSMYISAPALKTDPRCEYFRNMSIHRLTQRYWGAASNSDTRVETSDVLFNNVKLTILYRMLQF